MKLSAVAEIRAGHPFRGAVKEHPKGDVAVVQLRNVDPQIGVDWSNAVRTQIAVRRHTEWLANGDVIFAARGTRNFAVALSGDVPKAVCSPHFFVIQVADQNQIMPEFLAWQLNQAAAQRYFEQSSEGSNVQSIRRQVLGDLSLTIPPLPTQQSVVALNTRYQREQHVLRRLMVNRERQMQAVAQRLIG